MEMIDLAQSSVNSEEFYDYDDGCYSRDPRDLQNLFTQANVENKPLILRDYIPTPGGLGKIPETQKVLPFLQHQIRSKNPLVLCHILGGGSREMSNIEVLRKFEAPRDERKLEETVNILGYGFMHDPTLSMNITPIQFVQTMDLLRLVSCYCADQNQQRMNPEVATDCGFIVGTMPKYFTRFHVDVLSTSAMNSVGTKLWACFPDTEKNMEARESWKESDGMGAFERRIAFFLGPGDLLILPSGWHHGVYTAEVGEDESNDDTLMIGGHYIVWETAARNLEMLVKILGYDGLTNDPPERTMKHFQNLVGVMTF